METILLQETLLEKRSNISYPVRADSWPAAVCRYSQLMCYTVVVVVAAATTTTTTIDVVVDVVAVAATSRQCRRQEVSRRKSTGYGRTTFTCLTECEWETAVACELRAKQLPRRDRSSSRLPQAQPCTGNPISYTNNNSENK